MESLEINCTSPRATPRVSKHHQSSSFRVATRPTSTPASSSGAFLYVSVSPSDRSHVNPSLDVASPMESSPEDDVAVYHIIQRVESSPRNALTTGELTREASNASLSLDPVSNTAPESDDEDEDEASVDARGVVARRRRRRDVR